MNPSHKNCIIYLVRSSQDDIEMLNKSLALLYGNLLRHTAADVIIFHEKDFYGFISEIKAEFEIKYIEVDLERRYPAEIESQIPEFFPHPTHGNGPVAFGHPGFSRGYRNMCRFFSGEYLNYLQGYKYYLRLDTDSYILSDLGYDIFNWASSKDLIYGYCKQAVQLDNPLVVEGLKEFSVSFADSNSFNIIVHPNQIENGKMYYTNIELGDADWLKNSNYYNYYKEIDRNGGIYIHRWGDAPIKYIGINMFCDPSKIIPLEGFVYQHGAVYYL